MDFNPTLINGLPLQERNMAAPATATSTVSGPPLIPLEQTLGNTSVAQENAAQIQAAADRSAFPATKMETLSAAANNWVTTGVYHAMTDPVFPKDDSNPADTIKHLNFTMNDAQMKYVLGGTSVEARQFRADRVRAQMQEAPALSDNFWTGVLGTGGDPLMLAIPFGTAATAGRAGWAAKMAVAGAQSAALTGVAQTAMPMSNEDRILMGALEMVAAPTMAFKGTKKVMQEGKLVEVPVRVPVDPDFPHAELTQLARAVEPTPVAKPAAFGAHASSEAGDIVLEQVDGKFHLSTSYEGKVVDKEVFDSMDDAKEAFADAVDFDEATIGHQSWKDTADTLTIDLPEKAAPVPSFLKEGETYNFTTSKGEQITVTKEFAKMQPSVPEGYILKEEEKHAILRASTTDGKSVGTMDFAPGSNDLIVEVDKAYRRKGIGTVLYDLAENMGADLKTTEGALEISPDALALREARAKRVKDVVMYEDIGLTKERTFPADLTPNVPHEPSKAFKAVEKTVTKEATTFQEKTGQLIMLNIHKELSSFGPAGKEFADLMIDNNLDLSVNSVESIKRGAYVDLKNPMRGFDEGLMDAMAEEGAGTLQRIFNPESAKVQNKINSEVYLEMLRRDQASRQGRSYIDNTVPTRTTKMADSLDAVGKRSDAEQKAAGVVGSEGFEWKPGWISRAWDSLKIDTATNKLMAYGKTAKEAKAMLTEMLARSYADANLGMEWETAHDVATATLDRATRKGIYEDSAFIRNAGNNDTKVLRDELKKAGIEGQRLERVMGIMTGMSDEKAKAGFLKHRVAMDYTASLQLGDEVINVTDLLDHNAKGLMDNHIDKASAEIAMARKGYGEASKIDELRVRMMEETKHNPMLQEKAKNLFEGVMASTKGLPHGEQIGQWLRNMNALNRMTVLGAAGLWQLTEYAGMMYHYGALKTIKYAIQELPGFKQLMATDVLDKTVSTQLKDILEGAAADAVRMQPYVNKYADGMAMPESATRSARLEHATQLVPMLNGMKYVHGHQARIMANHIIDSINGAVRGDTKMAAQLEKYGLNAETLAKLKTDVTAHGMDVAKWSDGAWQSARPAVMKMMDEGVLHARMGDMPSWMMLSSVGKFLGTYRGFVFAAHNKLLAGTMARDGFAGVALMMLYQMPITAVVAQANAVMNGKPPLSIKELVAATFTRMGMFGLFGDVVNVLQGNDAGKTAATIPLSRSANLIHQGVLLASGEGSKSKFAHAAFQVTPALAVIPVLKMMESLTVNTMAKKEKEQGKTKPKAEPKAKPLTW